MSAKQSLNLWRSKMLQPLLPWDKQPIRPAEIGDDLCTLMLDLENVLEDASYQKIAPNHYVIELNTENYTRNYQPIEARILQQWREKLLKYLLTTNSRQGRKEYRLSGPLKIEIRADEALKAYQARVLFCLQPETVASVQQTANLSLELLADGRRWTLKDGVTRLGRNAQCEVHLDSALIREKRLISGQHAYILCKEGRCQLFDGSPDGKPSMNGTFINERRVPDGGQALQNGDLVILASLHPDQPDPNTPGAAALRFILEEA